MRNKIMDALQPLLPQNLLEPVATAIEAGVAVRITGRQGPTGKSTLAKKLQALGLDAAEVWDAAEDKDDENTASILITLIKPLN
ncbi:MAG: hypothetical protein RR461_11210 [Angelakisella sp.]